MNPNDLSFIPHELTATSMKGLQRKIIRFTQNTGLKINKWHIQKIDETYHYYFEAQVDEYEIQKAQLKIEEVDNGE